jgi:hypothetical protein
VLTEEDRVRIKEEEIFREEVRLTLQPPAPVSKPTFRSRAWTLVNSSIVLWFLSSVVIAGVTQLYSCQQSQHAEQVRKHELQRRLDTEIGNRIYQTVAGLDVWKTNVAHGGWTGTTRGTYGQMAQYLNNALTNVDYSVFSEYRSRSFSSLLIELSTLVEPSEVADLKDTLSAYHRVALLSSDTTGDRPNTQEQAIVTTDEAISTMRKHFQKPRWRIALYPER